MTANRFLVALVVAISPPGIAQEQLDNAEVVKRVREGGWFQESKWRRSDDGLLELHFYADSGMPQLARFVPLLGTGFEDGLVHSGTTGLVAMLCHGPEDLLAMTNGEFHLRALGVDTSDVGLRQYLALPSPSFEGGVGRAEMLERMLAIDVLTRRGTRTAIGELTAIARGDQPAPLRERARHAIERLEGRPTTVKRRKLTPETLSLPFVFDACVIIDHSRLPDMGWLPPFGRRLGALVTAHQIEQGGGSLTHSILNGAQKLCDLSGELPFGLAHRYGNGRIDHSCLVVTVTERSKLGIALAWQAAGEFEHEDWQDAVVTPRTVRKNPLFGGELEVTAESLHATVGCGPGKPRAEMAKTLLRDDGAAIRGIVPKTSKLWWWLQHAKLPPASGAELRITFGDPAVLELRVDTRDEDEADEWKQVGAKMLAKAKTDLDEQLPRPMREHEDLMRLLGALFGAELSIEGTCAIARARLGGVTPEVLRSIAETAAITRIF